jgi:7-dehydrocholesterol reductase
MLLIPTPPLCLVLAFLTCSPELEQPPGSRTVRGLVAYAQEHGGILGLVSAATSFCGVGDAHAYAVLAVAVFSGLLLYWWPGKLRYGPPTPTGHVPDYIDNGIAHCFLSTLMFLAGSNFCLGWWDLGVIFDVFGPLVGALNCFGLLFCFVLYFKGLYFPSGAGLPPDCGRSGYGPIFDYYWGTELYPRICGIDIKKFINCRFSMSFWQLAGISFAYKSYTLHGKMDPGIILCATSQYLYLVKFFIWEVGYMRSIDIIVDRAGFYETWGCIVFVPSLYTFHTRIMVLTPSGLSWAGAGVIFAIGMAGVGLNWWADTQRQVFREKMSAGKKCLVWGKDPVYITASYTMRDASTGKTLQKQSLLLASGFWGVAR